MGSDGNKVWAAMSAADKAALEPITAVVHLPKNDVLLRRGDVVDRVYLPISADVSNVISFADGSMATASNVGNEGVTGLAAFLAHQPMAWDMIVAVAGDAIRIPVGPLRERVRGSEALMHQLLNLTHMNQWEAAQNAVCNTHHNVPGHLAKWLLMTADRVGRSAIELSQEDMAYFLGVQRTTVNAAWAILRDAGAVKGARGKVQLSDRNVLKQLSCECYRAFAGRD